jgi:hypothetical protein
MPEFLKTTRRRCSLNIYRRLIEAHNEQQNNKLGNASESNTFGGQQAALFISIYLFL